VTIRAKLYTALVVGIAGLVLTVSVGIWGMSRLGDRFDRVQKAADAQALALQLKFDVTDFNGWQTAYGYDNGRSRPTFLRSVARFRTDLARAKRGLRRPAEKKALTGITAAFDDFMELDRQAFAALQAGRGDEVRQLFLGPEITNFSRAAAAAQTLASYEKTRAASEEKSFKDARRDALRLLVIVSAIAAVLIAILLVTANDLARSAERALGASAPH
jgi:CHASE3 domain sensor protein